MALRRMLPVLLVLATSFALPSPARADDVESQVMSKINAGRGTSLILHHGLLQDAESHSQYMAQSGNLNHDDAQERVNNAPPDPAEGNGAPDDGFNLYAWCENATYVTPAQGDPATAIYNNWKNSPPHNACMNNSGKNVGAVGIYWDGSTYWATFVAEVDSTPPGGGSGTPKSSPTAQDVTNPSQPTKVVPAKPEGVYPQPTHAPAPAPAYVSHYDNSYGTTLVVASPSPKPTTSPAKKRVTAPANVLV